MLKAKNCHLQPKTGGMDYIRFGKGRKNFIIVPGVGDGLKTVKGMAMPFAILYRRMAKDFTVYVFSRLTLLAPHTDTREMAADLNKAMDALDLSDACVLGVSQGGMIAQWLAIDYPDRWKGLF